MIKYLMMRRPGKMVMLYLPVMFLSSMFHWMRGGLVVGSRARLALHPEYGTRTISTMS